MSVLSRHANPARSAFLLLVCLSVFPSHPSHAADDATSIFGIYSDVRYIDEDGAGDLIGDEIHIINTGRTPYIVYLSFEGGPAVPILVKAEVTGRLIEFSFSETGSQTITFRGQVEGCELSGSFFYPHERRVKLHRESVDCR